MPTAARTVAATLYNSLGQQVCYLTLPATSEAVQAEVPTAHLPAGVYLLHLTISNKWGEELGKLPTQRLVVE